MNVEFNGFDNDMWIDGQENDKRTAFIGEEHMDCIQDRKDTTLFTTVKAIHNYHQPCLTTGEGIQGLAHVDQQLNFTFDSLQVPFRFDQIQFGHGTLQVFSVGKNQGFEATVKGLGVGY